MSALSLLASFAISAGTALASSPPCRYGLVNRFSDVDNPGYWYAEIQTIDSNGQLKYATLGAKAILTTGSSGSTPYVYDASRQHVNVFLSANEHYVDSTNPLRNSWIQIGWNLGKFPICYSDQTTTTPLDVYVEILDDTSNYCTYVLNGGAPQNASYDGRYYAVDSTNGKYQYRAYYQATGSPTIQYLGWGDFTDHYTVEEAGGEVYSENLPGQTLNCPILSHTASGIWDKVGQPTSDTFATTLQFYNGSGWQDWTTSTLTRVSMINSAGNTVSIGGDPYQLQTTSQYTQLKVGGGQ